MTTSTLDPRPRVLAGAALGLALAACRPALPPEPPGHDAADPDASVPAWSPSHNDYDGSAFDGVKLSTEGGHQHHGHGGHAGHAKGKKPATKQAEGDR